MTLLHTAVRAFKWSLLGEIGSRLIGPITFVLLARYLLPTDFGVIAAATVAVSFSQVFWDNGLARALVQRTDDSTAAADAVFWINLGLSLLLMLALIVAAPALASFFNDARIANVLRVLALQMPFAAVSAVLTALMYKRFEFRQLLWVRLTATGAPGLASIPLALSGWSYWALVAGILAGQVLQLAMLWRLAGWRVRWPVDRSLTLQLLDFGKWSMASGLLGWLYSWLDAIVVGHYLGSRDMGLYRTGNTLVTVIFGLIFSPLLPVLYSLFSRAKHELVRLREALLTVTHAIPLVSLPVGLGLLSMRNEIGELVFGPHWTGIGLVIGLLGLSHAVGWIAGANGELYRAIGKPHVETLAMFLMLAAYVPVYLITVQHGLDAFLWARVALSVLALVLHIVVCWRVVGISPQHWLRSCLWAALCAALAAGLAQWLTIGGSVAGMRILVMTAVGTAVYGVSILLFERTFIRRMFAIFIAGRNAPTTGGSY